MQQSCTDKRIIPFLKKYLLKSLILFIFSFSPSLLWADAQRDAVINQQLDCVENHSNHSPSPTWNDICYTNPKPVSEDVSTTTHNSDFEDDFFGSADLLEKNARENFESKDSRKHRFNVGSEYFFAKYEEPSVMKQKGTMYGISGFYQYRPNKGDLLYSPIANVMGVEGMFAKGDFDYRSQTQTGLQVDKEDSMYDVRGILGKEYYWDDYLWMMYCGLGYRYLNDDDNGDLVVVNGTGYYGYEREANYYYVPIGFNAAHNFSERNAVVIKGEFDFLAYGVQKSHLTDGNQFLTPSTLNEDATNPQRKGYGLRGSIAFSHRLKGFDVVFEPFIRYWHIEDSEVKTIMLQGTPTEVFEPENKTVEAGAKVAIQF